ncbi:MAG: hypothetical protein QOC65_830 [Sphingomonadales bacterium]|nr:hypothetical protein [Sphingomonadales bacterium]
MDGSSTGGLTMAYHFHQSKGPGANCTSFHLHESMGAHNAAVYVVVPTPGARRGSVKVLAKSARQLAKAALLEAAAAL